MNLLWNRWVAEFGHETRSNVLLPGTSEAGSMLEGIQKGHDVLSPWVIRVGAHDLLEKLNFVFGCFGVPSGRFDDFEGGVAVVTVTAIIMAL
jgi:hypothetical protein